MTAWLPSTYHSNLSWPTLNKLPLADPDFLIPGPIDLIIGADYYSQVIKPQVLTHDYGNLIAQQTIFGWAILGPIPANHHSSFSIMTTTNDDIQNLLTKFWELAEIPEIQMSSNTLTPDDQFCDQHFLETHSRNSQGRYVVRLPLAHPTSDLGNSYCIAFHNLKKLLHKLRNDPQYSNLYTKFMNEYHSLEHLVQISSPDPSKLPNYDLPHHGILKIEGDCIKFRAVFNSSSKTSNGLSLNDTLHTGIKLQSDIFEVLLYF